MRFSSETKALAALAGLLLCFPAAAQPPPIKTAVVTPEQSAWTRALRRMADEVSEKTGGEVRFRIYAGGVSGDEPDVLRKMQVNLIHAAGFSGVGLGLILPRVRVLEAPLLFRTYGEVDFIREILFEEMASGLRDRGFVLLGFAEAGFVHLFSKTAFSETDPRKDQKMWAWKGDPLAMTVMEALGFRTVPLHVADVSAGLETGLINAFYSPPLAAVAFQWHAKIRYVLDFPIVNSTGALILKKEVFDGLSPENRKILTETARKYFEELIRIARRENGEALSLMEGAGITLQAPSPAQAAFFEERPAEVRSANAGRLYSPELYRSVVDRLEAFRKSAGPPGVPKGAGP